MPVVSSLGTDMGNTPQAPAARGAPLRSGRDGQLRMTGEGDLVVKEARHVVVHAVMHGVARAAVGRVLRVGRHRIHHPMPVAPRPCLGSGMAVAGVGMARHPASFMRPPPAARRIRVLRRGWK
jgi:hypothetical protein